MKLIDANTVHEYEVGYVLSFTDEPVIKDCKGRKFSQANILSLKDCQDRQMVTRPKGKRARRHQECRHRA